MFTDIYRDKWNTLAAIEVARERRTGEYSFGPWSYVSTCPQVLWDPRLGKGGNFDRTVLDQSMAAKRRQFLGEVYAVVPIYVTSICSEHCLYCNYRAGNRRAEIERIRLTESELLREVEFLVQQKGLRALELVYATDPHLRVDSMCRHIELVRNYLDHHGGGIVGINAEALDESEYRMLRDAGLTFAVLWQETYDEQRYKELHPGSTKKARFEYRLEAYERMLAAGVQHIGMGVLSGLADWRRDWVMLMEHEAHIYRSHGIPAAILGVPRLKPAAGALVQNTTFTPTRQEFLLALAIHNLFSPQTLAFVNTREDWNLCVEMAAGGGCLFTFNCSTIPGGYSLGHRGYQFPTGTYDAPVFAAELQKCGLKPIFDWDFGNRVSDNSMRRIA